MAIPIACQQQVPDQMVENQLTWLDPSIRIGLLLRGLRNAESITQFVVVPLHLGNDSRMLAFLFSVVQILMCAYVNIPFRLPPAKQEDIEVQGRCSGASTPGSRVLREARGTKNPSN
jgi:hypothetical protein